MNITHTFTRIAKKAVLLIGEDMNFDGDGKCGEISEYIYDELNKQGYECDIIYATGGIIGNERRQSYTTHIYVFVYKYKLIIDTQLWQINQQPEDLTKRKCVFTWEEYNKFFKPTHTEKLT